MARKVIHEVNNPLSIIKNYLKILGIKLAEQEIAQDEIRILNEEIDRVALILRELNAFSDSRVEGIEALDVNALISDLVKITWESLRKDSNVSVQLALDPSGPFALADRNGLKQVLVNLIKNASEAMPAGGNVHIETRRLSSQLEEEEARERGEYQGYVELIISDDGPGIPAEMRARIFEPFVTSKETGHSGLGLSVVHSIIKDLNGTIDCLSEEGRGTTFRIGLPLAAE
jgi:signal transduction histidine kinase